MHEKGRRADEEIAQQQQRAACTIQCAQRGYATRAALGQKIVASMVIQNALRRWFPRHMRARAEAEAAREAACRQRDVRDAAARGAPCNNSRNRALVRNDATVLFAAAVDAAQRLKGIAVLPACVLARPSLIPSLCTRLTRAGIEWPRCHRAACMARPHKEPHHSGQAEP